MADLVLDDIDFGDAALNAAFAAVRAAAERANRWAASGPVTLEDGPGGFTLAVHPNPGMIVSAVVATTITARVSSTQLGQGTVYLRRRTSGTATVVQETAAVACYNPFNVALPVGHVIDVGPDREAWMVVGADCLT